MQIYYMFSVMLFIYNVLPKGDNSKNKNNQVLPCILCMLILSHFQFGSSLPPVVCRTHFLFTLFLHIVVSSTYYVVFLFCFSLSSEPYGAIFCGLSIFDCSFGILYCLFQTPCKTNWTRIWIKRVDKVICSFMN
jgi:hypothetical protein